jgi:hypothetical protein
MPVPSNRQTQSSARLALYGIAFRVLRSVALWPSGRPCTSEPDQPRPRRRTASLELEAAQSGPLHRPAVES